MHIRRAAPGDRDTLLDIWRRSVLATHAFLPDGEVAALTPLVRDYLASEATEFWVLCDDAGALVGFMGMAGGNMEALFLAPEHHRRGGGRRMVEHARALYGELTADVNEENEPARRFYEACGFVVAGRSELDGQGRPHPLLHLRLAGPAPPLSQGGAGTG